jgi:hypothetical protein
MLADVETRKDHLHSSIPGQNLAHHITCNETAWHLQHLELASVNWMLFCGFLKIEAASGMVFATC